MNKSILFQPIKIGTMEVPNRFVMPPMGTNLANRDGSMSQKFIDYYAERAKGGFGLITVEVAAVDPLGRAIINEAGLWSDEHIEGYRKVVDECHKYGAKVSIQLHHCGRETTPNIIDGEQPVGVTSIPCPMFRAMPHELTTEEVYEIIEKYGDAALRAKLAGADAVEVHAGHSYLISQFISQSSNHRVDEFGGSFENRMRFLKLIIENIKKKAGSTFPMLCRINGEEKVPGGNNKHETAALAKYLESLGVDAIHVTYGRTAGAWQWVVPPAYTRVGYSLDVAAEIKKAVSIPVISVGRHVEPYVAEMAVSSGMVDLISFGRQSMADPYLPNKFAANKLDELIPCITCLQGCSGSIATDRPLRCLANPFTGREGDTRIVKTDTPKKVMVVGSGPAGLVSAWISAAKGHKVACYEKADKLGGEFRIAGNPPTKGGIIHLLGNYINLCKKNGVEFHINTEVTTELIEKEAPDVVLLCTGAKPVVPAIPNINNVGAVAARDVLDGKLFVGQNVLVIGGGLVGAETADFLCEHGRNVTILEMLDAIAMEENANTRAFLLERLAKADTKIITGAKVKEFIEGGIVYTKNNEDATIDGFDTIVLAMGYRAYNPLEEEIKGKVKEVYVIGDATKATTALDATREAADVALKL